MIELSYNDVKKEFVESLNHKENLVLSTCHNNKITSRMMCYVNEDLVIYLLTGKRTTKCRQINENENVALCIDNIQIEGKAKIVGNPTENDNININRVFRNKHPKYYERFAHFKVATYIEVKCEYLKQWKMENGKDCYYCLDVIRQKATKHG